MDRDTRAGHRLLPAQPSSVPDARHALREWLHDAGAGDLVDEAEQAVSEVVTNALVHAGTPVELSATIDPGFVRVEVVDGSAHLPRVVDFDMVSGTGRGLKVLEQSVSRWGAEPRGDGKVVWFELGDRRAGAAEAEGEGGERPGPRETLVDVELLGVPLLLMPAWIEHAGALLRESLLLDLEAAGADAGEALRTHAVASELLALVEAQVPKLDLGLAPHVLMAGATEPQVTAPRVALRVPRDLVRSFPVLDAALDRARQLAASGVLLTAPTQPEMQELRHWLTGEIARQTAGGAPRPWVASMSARGTVEVDPLPWDQATVDEATTPVVACDDYNVVVAVSGPALELLGHARNTLVGRRMLAIIPLRFRQAHLAGFTLHQVNGRSPLLDETVTVPVLRADGTERLVRLTVTCRSLPGGRNVFLGALEPLPDDT